MFALAGGRIRRNYLCWCRIFRTAERLEQTVIIPMRRMVPAALAVYNGTMHMFTFANGSIVKFGHYGANDDLEYQGQEYDWIFMDEATQFTEYQFRVLGACLQIGRAHV